MTDLTIDIREGKMNIRVAAWIEHEDMILCSTFPDSFTSLPGGRVKFGETTTQALIREIQEELTATAQNVRLIAIIENFFTDQAVNYHEYLYVYKVNITYQSEYYGDDGQVCHWLPKQHITTLYPTSLNKVDPATFTHLVHKGM